VREGSLLKCSDSMKRSSRFQLMEAGATGGGGCWGVEGWAWTNVYCKVSLGMFGVQMYACWRGYVRRVDLAGEMYATIVTIN